MAREQRLLQQQQQLEINDDTQDGKFSSSPVSVRVCTDRDQERSTSPSLSSTCARLTPELPAVPVSEERGLSDSTQGIEEEDHEEEADLPVATATFYDFVRGLTDSRSTDGGTALPGTTAPAAVDHDGPSSSSSSSTRGGVTLDARRLVMLAQSRTRPTSQRLMTPPARSALRSRESEIAPRYGTSGQRQVPASPPLGAVPLVRKEGRHHHHHHQDDDDDDDDVRAPLSTSPPSNYGRGAVPRDEQQPLLPRSGSKVSSMRKKKTTEYTEPTPPRVGGNHHDPIYQMIADELMVPEADVAGLLDVLREQSHDGYTVTPEEVLDVVLHSTADSSGSITYDRRTRRLAADMKAAAAARPAPSLTPPSTGDLEGEVARMKEAPPARTAPTEHVLVPGDRCPACWDSPEPCPACCMMGTIVAWKADEERVHDYDDATCPESRPGSDPRDDDKIGEGDTYEQPQEQCSQTRSDGNWCTEEDDDSDDGDRQHDHDDDDDNDDDDDDDSYESHWNSVERSDELEDENFANLHQYLDVHRWTAQEHDNSGGGGPLLARFLDLCSENGHHGSDSDKGDDAHQGNGNGTRGGLEPYMTEEFLDEGAVQAWIDRIDENDDDGYSSFGSIL